MTAFLFQVNELQNSTIFGGRNSQAAIRVKWLKRLSISTQTIDHKNGLAMNNPILIKKLHYGPPLSPLLSVSSPPGGVFLGNVLLV